MATLEAPRASVTRRRTTWLPAVANDVIASGPDTLKAPVPARSHEKAAIGLAVSVDPDTSTTVCPITGAGGNQLNEATGGGIGCEGGAVSVNVSGALAPVLPASSRCSACAVYVPGRRPPKIADQLAPEVGTSRASTAGPVAADPACRTIVTAGRSCAAVPAEPVSSCDSPLAELPFAG